MVLAFQLTSGNAGKYFTVVLSLAISTTTISYLLVFPALIKLRYSHPHVPRPYRVPFGNAGAWACSLLPTGWAALATRRVAVSRVRHVEPRRLAAGGPEVRSDVRGLLGRQRRAVVGRAQMR